MLANFKQHCWPVLQVASICYTCQHFGQHFQSLESFYVIIFFMKMLAKMLSGTWQIVPTCWLKCWLNMRRPLGYQNENMYFSIGFQVQIIF